MQPDNYVLKEAIDCTVSESLFSFQDIKHRILALKQSLKREHLHKWAVQSGLIDNSMNGKTILCLHAGNLPLVGIQDLLAVIMTGGHYLGKLSRKDPYLLESLIIKLREHGFGSDSLYQTNLESIESIKADAVLFAGSERSIESVKDKLLKLNMIDSDTPLLVRTAYYSVAWIHDQKPETMNLLMESVFRYAGKGCRSVAVVVAPFSFTSDSCNFTDYIESFWIKQPQLHKPPASLYHRYAMNRAVGIPQIWLEDFLIEETLKIPDENFILQWVTGGKDELIKIIKKSPAGLQSIYSIDTFVGKNIESREIEPLDKAQNPSIWWKPDGIDTIHWLQNHSVSKG